VNSIHWFRSLSVQVFVYGTLKPGECNFDRYCADRILHGQAAIAYGRLFNLSLGYPAMTEGDCPVYGYLLTFRDVAVLDELDELEVRRAVFDRQWGSVGEAWVYLMSGERVDRLGGKLLPQGIWTAAANEGQP
jgi:gamma-glutamylcyclotransferase (GGCT)/AIG2-like uncharacterized protein YtfP